MLCRVLYLLLLQLAGVSCQGAVYTRWGRTICGASGDELVYPGAVGGTFYSTRGGASNYVCLTREPVWANYQSGVQKGGEMYGTEYQLQNFDPFQGSESLHQGDAPCAVCHSTIYSSMVMIPGTTVCTSGWQRAYRGYLMSTDASTDYTQYRTEYICVDSDPEPGIAGESNLNGALLYSVEARCGSLPCPPYVEGRELTCVVCLK